MRENIRSVLKKLEKRAELEKSEKIQVNHDERMLAISSETGEFFNILLKAMKAKKILEIGMSVGFSTLWFADAILANNGTLTLKHGLPEFFLIFQVLLVFLVFLKQI